jgi:hypothetical protein
VQKTTRLVVLPLLMAAALLLLAMPSQAAHGQGAPRVSPRQQPAETWGDKTPPADFVKSKGPATSGSAYNWVQMGYASIVMLVMGGFIVVLIRKNAGKGSTGEGGESASQLP